MSAIDTINHAHVGNFFNIPIYWFLEEVKLSQLVGQDDTKKVNQFFMSVGGGSGEHNALILNNEAILVKFLNNIKDEIKTEEFNKTDRQIFELTAKIQDDYVTNHADIYQFNLDQNQWPLETFIGVNEGFNKLYHSDESLQVKLQNAFALFIIYELPLKYCLKNPQLVEVATLIRTDKWKSIFEDKDILEKYVGFEKVINKDKAGKITKENKTVWGYSLDDWKEDNSSFELSEKLTLELPEKNHKIKIKI